MTDLHDNLMIDLTNGSFSYLFQEKALDPRHGFAGKSKTAKGNGKKKNEFIPFTREEKEKQLSSDRERKKEKEKTVRNSRNTSRREFHFVCPRSCGSSPPPASPSLLCRPVVVIVIVAVVVVAEDEIWRADGLESRSRGDAFNVEGHPASRKLLFDKEKEAS